MTERNHRALLSEELTVAADVLSQFCNGADLEKTFDSALKPTASSASKGRSGPTGPTGPSKKSSGKISSPAVKEFVYRAVRSLHLLQSITAQLNTKLPAPWVHALQQLVIAQLLQMHNSVDEVASNARIVDQAIEAVKAHSEHAFAAGFVNATLRRFLRERDQLLLQAKRSEEAQFNYPLWWLRELEKSHPDGWKDLAQAGDAQAPFCLRVNQRIGSALDYALALKASHPTWHCEPVTNMAGVNAVIISPAVPVKDVPGFAQGHVSVQDAGAQLAANWLDLQDGHKVLDACAAPGGKTVHCLELADVDMTALDLNPERLARVAENLSRFRASRGSAGAAVTAKGPVAPDCKLKVGDARLPSTWWDGTLFDRILADVPCSASGIVRRHPDIRWRRQRGDLATFSAQQLEILNGLWPLLKPGGKLLYVTCSLFAQEGHEVIAKFMQNRRHVVQEELNETNVGLSNFRNGYLLPNDQKDKSNSAMVSSVHDGFFYARLVKSL
jgi:16S rRNA (cytosine967-C5)-methyltransferase